MVYFERKMICKCGYLERQTVTFPITVLAEDMMDYAEDYHRRKCGTRDISYTKWKDLSLTLEKKKPKMNKGIYM